MYFGGLHPEFHAQRHDVTLEIAQDLQGLYLFYWAAWDRVNKLSRGPT